MLEIRGADWSSATSIELRHVGDDGSLHFEGFAIPYDTPSRPIPRRSGGPFIETVRRGAPSETLDAGDDVWLLRDHDEELLLATTRSTTLDLAEEYRGLFANASIPPTTYARDTGLLMRAGMYDRMSFGFKVKPQGDRWDRERRQRELLNFHLAEVSIVRTGTEAYQATMASVRHIDRLADRGRVPMDELAAALRQWGAGRSLSRRQVDIIIQAVEAHGGDPDEPVVDEERAPAADLERLRSDLESRDTRRLLAERQAG